ISTAPKSVGFNALISSGTAMIRLQYISVIYVYIIPYVGLFWNSKSIKSNRFLNNITVNRALFYKELAYIPANSIITEFRRINYLRNYLGVRVYNLL
ncbi:hypothetical protein, partial [Sarcina sp. DSM 11001]|uniref:hypothetical protein n=1 Tax=Sarcina sp. DSM 11001 TaxID=1798184 RepID=UPI001A9A5B53